MEDEDGWSWEMIKYHYRGEGSSKFLWVVSGKYVLERDGEFSRETELDVCERDGIDASAIVCWKLVDGRPHIYLRTCIRPAIGLREENGSDGVGWEIPAGKIDEGEDAKQCAIRELFEEVGYCSEQFGIAGMCDLGSHSYPAVGVIGERLYYYEVEVIGEPTKPNLDGSVLEAWGEVKLFSLDEALKMVRSGIIRDGKTEIGLCRFKEAFLDRRKARSIEYDGLG